MMAIGGDVLVVKRREEDECYSWLIQLELKVFAGGHIDISFGCVSMSSITALQILDR